MPTAEVCPPVCTVVGETSLVLPPEPRGGQGAAQAAARGLGWPFGAGAGARQQARPVLAGGAVTNDVGPLPPLLPFGNFCCKGLLASGKHPEGRAGFLLPDASSLSRGAVCCGDVGRLSLATDT